MFHFEKHTKRLTDVAPLSSCSQPNPEELLDDVQDLSFQFALEAEFLSLPVFCLLWTNEARLRWSRCRLLYSCVTEEKLLENRHLLDMLDLQDSWLLVIGSWFLTPG